jgi:hypothetical protein
MELSTILTFLLWDRWRFCCKTLMVTIDQHLARPSIRPVERGAWQIRLWFDAHRRSQCAGYSVRVME